MGDFNVITTTDEKQSGIPCNMKKILEFVRVIIGCGLTNIGFTGQKFTWCNNRGPLFRILKRLDRAMVNDKWLEIMLLTTITHLSIMGSDHYPLLMEISTRSNNITKYFKFLNFWVDQPEFSRNCKELLGKAYRWGCHVDNPSKTTEAL